MHKNNAIVSCCTSDWLPYAAVTLLSCHQQGASETADLFVVVLDATDSDTQRFEDFLRRHGFKARLLNVTLPEEARGMEANAYGAGTLLRLFLADFLPPSYRRVLYVDSDVYAGGEIHPLFEIDLQGKAVAAVLDWAWLDAKRGNRFWSSHFAQLGLQPQSRYFNAGVMLMDWQRVVREGRLQNCVRVSRDLKQRGARIQTADQDLLNVEFENDWQPLPLRFNLMEQYVNYVSQPFVLRHFNSTVKPWHPVWTPQYAAFHLIYRNLLEGSGWPEPARTRFTLHSFRALLGYLLEKFNSARGRDISAAFEQAQQTEVSLLH